VEKRTSHNEQQEYHSNADSRSSIKILSELAEPFCACILVIMTTTPNHEKAHFAQGVKKDAKLYLACFDYARQLQQYWNKWIHDEGWIDIMNE
jgi:hypothetical protein